MKQIAKWCIPCVFLITGIIVYLFVSGCDFLGLVLCGVALIIAGYNLLSLWEKQRRIPAKVVRTIVSVILILALIAVGVTLVPILQGPAGGAGGSEYVIVLGAGVKNSEPSEILRDRIDRAYEYLTAHPDAICIATGGKGDDENISEALCIYNHLTAMGIDGDRIWMEDQATSTIENFRYSIALIEEKTGSTPETVTVLSSEFHLYRASRMASDCGLTADFIPAPTGNLLIRVSYTIREVFALWKYLLLET